MCVSRVIEGSQAMPEDTGHILCFCEVLDESGGGVRGGPWLSETLVKPPLGQSWFRGQEVECDVLWGH